MAKQAPDTDKGRDTALSLAVLWNMTSHNTLKQSLNAHWSGMVGLTNAFVSYVCIYIRWCIKFECNRALTF